MQQLASLSTDAKRFLRYCGYHPSRDLDRHLIPLMLGTTPGEAEHILAALAAAELAAPDPNHQNRLRLPASAYELANQLATEHGDDHERMTIQRRVRRWYHRAMITIAYRLDPYARYNHAQVDTDAPCIATTADEAMEWFAAEHATVSVLLDQAAADGDNTWVWQLVTVAWAPIRKGHYNNVLIDWHHLAADAAKACKRLDVRAVLLARQSCGYRDVGDHDAACSIAERATGLAVAAADRSAESTALHAAGSAYLAAGHLSSADHLFTRARILATKIRDTHAVALLDCHRADCAAAQQQPQRALALYTAAARNLAQQGDVEARARCLCKKAELLVHCGKPQQARTIATEQIATLADSGSPAYLADLYRVLAITSVALGKSGQARRHAAQAAELYLTGRRPDKAHAMGTWLADL